MELNDLAKVISSLKYDDMKYFSDEVLYRPLRDYIKDLIDDNRLEDLDFDVFASYMTEWAKEFLIPDEE